MDRTLDFVVSRFIKIDWMGLVGRRAGRLKTKKSLKKIVRSTMIFLLIDQPKNSC